VTYADVNGLSLAYQEHGSGSGGDGGDDGGDGAPALILLHGGFGSGDMFEPILPELTKARRVVTVDLQAHGRTADIERPLRFESMADDVGALIARLGPGPVDVMGYSLGGGVALRTAIQHPQLVRRLVLVSTPCSHDGFFPEVAQASRQVGTGAAGMMMQSPIYQNYARVAPRVEDWPVLVGKMGELISRDYDWSAQVPAITAPTLLVYGDADSFRPAHMIEFYGLLGGGQRDAGWPGSGIPPRSASQLAVLPGTTHYDIFLSPALTTAVNAFLQ
jgi:pimeloyl-ACP methyl ester carboxylesterase